MAFDNTQPYATVNTDAGNIYYLQNGVYYQSFNLQPLPAPPAPVDGPGPGTFGPKYVTDSSGNPIAFPGLSGTSLGSEVFDAPQAGRSVAKMDGTDGTLALTSAHAGEAVSIDTTTYSVPMVKCTLSTTAAAVFQATYTLTTPQYIGGFSGVQVVMAFGDMSASEIANNSTNPVVQLWIKTVSNLYNVRPQLGLVPNPPGTPYVVSFGRDCLWGGGDAPSRLDEDQIISIIITITAGSSSVAKAPIWVGPITATQRRKKGSLLIYADGEFIEQNKYFIPMLDNFGLKLNLALVARSVVSGGGATPTTMNENQIAAAYANGHLPLIHTAGAQTSGWDNTTSYPDGTDNGFTSVYNELVAGDAWLTARGWTRGLGHRVSGYTNAFASPATPIPNARQLAIEAAFVAAGTRTVRFGGGFNHATITPAVGSTFPGGHPLANWRHMVGCLQIDGGQATARDCILQMNTVAQRGEVGSILLHHPVINTASVSGAGTLAQNLSETLIWVERAAALVAAGVLINETVDVCYNRLKGH